MNAPDIDQFLVGLGFDDPADRQQLRQDIETTTQDMAVSKLLKGAQLTDAEKNILKGVYKTKDQPHSTLNPLFATPHGQQAYQQSLAEALQIVTYAQTDESSDKPQA